MKRRDNGSPGSPRAMIIISPLPSMIATTSGTAGRKTTAHICAPVIGQRGCTICSSPRASGSGGLARRFLRLLGRGLKEEGYATWSGKRVMQQSLSTSAWVTPVIPALSPSILSSRSSSPATAASRYARRESWNWGALHEQCGPHSTFCPVGPGGLPAKCSARTTDAPRSTSFASLKKYRVGRGTKCIFVN